MYRNLLLSAIACFCLAISVSAQKIDVKVSPEFKLKKSKIFAGHIDSDDTGHYVYYNLFSNRFDPSPTLVVAKYNNKFKEVWSHEYLADKKGVHTYGLKPVKGSFLWLLSEKSGKNKLDYYLATIDKNGDFGKKTKVNSITFDKKRDQPGEHWVISEDSTKVSVIHIFDRDKQKLDFEYNVSMVDDQLNELWSQKVRTRKSQEQIDVLSSVIGNDGAHYMLVKEYESRNAKESKRSKGRGKSKKVAAYDLKIYKLAEGMTAPEIIKLDLKERFAKGASLKVADNGEISCIGMFKNQKRGNINGVYYLRMDAQGTPIKSNFKKFSKSDLEHLGSKNTGKKKGDEGIDASFSFGEQLTLSDGTIVVSAEENFVVYHRDGRGNVTTTFHSRDIIVVTFDSEGVIQSIKLIPKRQSAGTPAFISHTAMAVEIA